MQKRKGAHLELAAGDDALEQLAREARVLLLELAPRVGAEHLLVLPTHQLHAGALQLAASDVKSMRITTYNSSHRWESERVGLGEEEQVADVEVVDVVRHELLAVVLQRQHLVAVGQRQQLLQVVVQRVLQS